VSFELGQKIATTPGVTGMVW